MIDLSSLSPIEILGLTLIGESRGETIAGQVAVGCVIRNRANHNKSTYHEVCLAPKQFSCWNEDDPNRSLLVELAEQLINGQFITDPYLKQCMYVANGIVEGDLLDNTNGAMNYLTAQLFFDGKTPSWAKQAKNLKTIGNQIFFNV
jgi:spore germination cell wall hydrolase CwlJ-like protein